MSRSSRIEGRSKHADMRRTGIAGSWARAKTSACGIAEMRWTGQQPANPASDWLVAVHPWEYARLTRPKAVASQSVKWLGKPIGTEGGEQIP